MNHHPKCHWWNHQNQGNHYWYCRSRSDLRLSSKPFKSDKEWLIRLYNRNVMVYWILLRVCIYLPLFSRGSLSGATPPSCLALVLWWTGQSTPAAGQSRLVLLGLGCRHTATAWRCQVHWLAVLQTIQPLGTGRCGCLGALVRRDRLKCSPLLSSNKKPLHRRRGRWKDQLLREVRFSQSQRHIH